MNREQTGDQLEERLTALLGGPGLDLPPRADATGLITGRVRRARRRRTALQVAVPAVLTVLTIATGLSVLPEHDDSPVPAAPDVLSSSGVGGLKIGMPIQDAEKAGFIRADDDANSIGSCKATYRGLQNVSEVIARQGVVAEIRVNAFIRTPEGIQTGSTVGDLRKAYGSTVRVVKHRTQIDVVPAGGNGTKYEFGLVGDGNMEGPPVTDSTRILTLELISTRLTC